VVVAQVAAQVAEMVVPQPPEVAVPPLAAAL